MNRNQVCKALTEISNKFYGEQDRTAEMWNKLRPQQNARTFQKKSWTLIGELPTIVRHHSQVSDVQTVSIKVLF